MRPRLRFSRHRDPMARLQRAALRFIPAIQGLEDRKVLSGTPPMAGDGGVSTPHNHSVSGSLDAFDADGSAVTVDLLSGPSHGSLSLDGGVAFTYTPDIGYVGQDSFTFDASDQNGTSDPASETIDVTNQAPLALSNTLITLHDHAIAGLLNGFDVDGDVLTFSLVSGPSGGTVTLNSDGSVFYTPTPSFVGQDSFTFDVTDPYGATATTTEWVLVENHIPMVLDSSVSTLPDRAVSGWLDARDLDYDTLTFTSVSGPSHGSVTVRDDGTFTYTPDPGFVGQDSFAFQSNDGLGDSFNPNTGTTDATETIDVTDQYQGPVAYFQSLSMVHDRSLSGLLHASHMDGDDVTFSLVSGPSNGSLSLNTDGTFSYTPTPGTQGSDLFTFDASDQYGTSSSTFEPVNVTNHAPVVGGGTTSTLHDHAVSGSVFAFDEDGDPITLIVVNGPSHGSVTVSEDRSFTYTPDPGFIGQDSFSFMANDGITHSNIATETIDVTNQAPKALDGNVAPLHNQKFTGSLTGEDDDGDTLTYSLVRSPSNGTLTLDDNGSFDYMPTPGFLGQDSFTFKANDGIADSNVATVTIDVTNQAPVAYDQSFIATQYNSYYDGYVDQARPGAVYASDAEGDALSFSQVSGPTHGVLTFTSNGSFTYRPDRNYAGQDTFTFKTSDGSRESNIATVTINTTNQAPVAYDDYFNILKDNSCSWGVPVYDPDYHPSTLYDLTGMKHSVVLVNGPSNGTLTLNADGSFVYTPNPGFVGQDTFTYKANDGISDSNVGTVHLDVFPDPGLTSVGAGGSYWHDTIGFVTVSAGIFDSPPYYTPNYPVNPKSYTILSGFSHGTLTDSDALGFAYWYTPDPGFIGVDTMVVKVSDGYFPDSVTCVRVIFSNDAPVASNRSVSTIENTMVSCVDAYPHGMDDSANETFTAVPVRGPAHGTLTLGTDGAISYTPDPYFFGQDRFTYKINDGLADSNVAVVTVSVNPSVTVDLFDDGDPSADTLETDFSAEVTDIYGNDVGDGSVVQWRVVGPNGTLDESETTTSGGFTSNTLHTSALAGDDYKVYAKVISLVQADGQVQAGTASPEVMDEVTVVPGQASDITFDVDDNRLPADGTSTTKVTLTARDAEGNLVPEGTVVNWGLVGSGSLTGDDPSTIDENGQASVTLRAGIYPGAMTVSASIGDTEASTEVESLPVHIQLGITGNVLTLGTTETQTVTATVTDADGQPVAVGTPISWFAQKGTISGDAVVGLGGVAHATLSALGGSQVSGQGFVRASVGSHSDGLTYLWVPQAGALAVQADHYVLAGDQTADGSYPIEQADGSMVNYDYHTEANITITGEPDEVVQVTLGKDTEGNIYPTGGLVMQLGGSETVTVTLDDQGRATLQVRTSGGLNPLQGIIVPVLADIVGDSSMRGVTINITIQPAQFLASTWDSVAKLGWGAIAGEGNSIEEIAGDMAFSMIPVVGAYSDVRDMSKELLKLWPGGDSPNWWYFGFSTFGVVGSFLGPEVDWLPTLGKQVARTLDASKGVWRSLMDLTKKADFASLDNLKSLVLKLVDPAHAKLKEIAERFVNKTDDLMTLNRVIDGPTSDETIALIEEVGNELGSKVAKNMLATLGRLSDEQLAFAKANGKMEVLIKGVSQAGWGSNQAKQYVDQVRRLGTDSDIVKTFDQFADVKGSGNFLVRGLDDADGGVQAELAVAKKFEGETVVQFAAKPGTDIKGDIDVVTNTRVFEVKAGRPSNLVVDGEDVKKFKRNS